VVLEQEMKLSVLGNAQVDLAQLVFQGFQCSEIVEQRLISTYFDTLDLMLLKKSVGLRLRFNGSQWFQTVKESGQVKNGLHQRHEWEDKIPTNDFDLSLLKQTPLNTLIDDKTIWTNISQLFTTDFIRQTILVSDENTSIELAYDKGTISNEEKTIAIHEIELELKRGNINQLQALSTQLMTQLPLKTTNKSKAQLGYALRSTKVQL
jgi:inorganic triphosphatase YgiF